MKIDWAAVAKHVTPVNVAKWVLVIGFAAFVIITLSWLAALAWESS